MAKGWGGTREKVVIDELLTRQVASLLIKPDSTTASIASDLNISYTLARKLVNSPAVRGMLKEVGEASLVEAKNRVRKGTADLVELSLEVLKESLEKDRSLEAVKLTFKTLGALDQQEEKDGGITAINVVLPGSNAKESKIVEIEHEDVGKGT